MTPADKQKIKDAFNNAVKASPFADEVLEGIRTQSGDPVTRRQMVAWTLEHDEFYNQVDKVISSGKVTLDQFITKFEDGMKKSNKGGPKP